MGSNSSFLWKGEAAWSSRPCIVRWRPGSPDEFLDAPTGLVNIRKAFSFATTSPKPATAPRSPTGIGSKTYDDVVQAIQDTMWAPAHN